MSSKSKPGTSCHAAASKSSETIDPLCCTARCYLHPVTGVHIFGVPGLPEIVAGTDLAPMIFAAAAAGGEPLLSGDVVVVTSKIVSKAEGRTIELADVEPSAFALEWSKAWDKEPAL